MDNIEELFELRPLDLANSFLQLDELVTLLGLALVVYVVTDQRTNLRLSLLPYDLRRLSFYCFALAFAGKLLFEIIGRGAIPIPKIIPSMFWVDLAFIILLATPIFLLTYFAFIWSPTVTRYNAEQVRKVFEQTIARGEQTELIAAARVSTGLVRSLVRLTPKIESQEQLDKAPKYQKHIWDFYFIIAQARFVSVVVQSQPQIAVRFLNEVRNNPARNPPIAPFINEVCIEMITNPMSIVRSEWSDYKRDYFSVVRPYSEYLFVNPENVKFATQRGIQPFGDFFMSGDKLDSAQLSVLASLYIEYWTRLQDQERVREPHAAFPLFDGFSMWWLVSGKEVFEYKSEAYRKFAVVIRLIKGILTAVNSKEQSFDHEGRLVNRVSERVCQAIYEIIFALGRIEGPEGMGTWGLYFSDFWCEVFDRFEDRNGVGQAAIEKRIRRMIYDETKDMERYVNYKSARVLGFVLYITSIFSKGDRAGRNYHERVLWRYLSGWFKKNMMKVYHSAPKVAEACMVGGMRFDPIERTITRDFMPSIAGKKSSVVIHLDAVKFFGAVERA